ncbi:MAG: NAD(P)/FAD-dependent oxidoreductase [Methanobacteriota archaeon]|nr:MAG: NAD(P)/FAD-dependent oxidoreductase [Euryarchaeota archaeon]
MDERVSVVVIGSGPAGAAAGMFLKRAGLEPLLLEEGEPGGLLREANLVENYPGFPEGIVGGDLASLIEMQLKRLQVKLDQTEAINVIVDDDGFLTTTASGRYVSDYVVIATGTSPRRTNIPGAAEIEGRLLHYGVSSLKPKNIVGKRIAVLGGGDAAFDYAINLSGKGGSVTIISRSEPTCLSLLVERARARGVDVITGGNITELSEAANRVAINFEHDGSTSEIISDLIIVAYGREPRLDALDPSLKEGLTVDRPPVTNIPGLFIAGDVARGMNRQASIAVGDGVLAAMMIQQLLRDGGEHA